MPKFLGRIPRTGCASISEQMAITNISSSLQNIVMTCVQSDKSSPSAHATIAAHATALFKGCLSTSISTLAEYIESVDQSNAQGVYSFYIMPGQSKPKVSVTANHVPANVVIQLGLKAAYLDLVIAPDDGNDVKANVIFSRLDLPGTFRTSVAGHQKIPVPPVPFHMVVEAPGLEPWVYKGTNGNGLVNLRPSETLTLDVKFQRAAK